MVLHPSCSTETTPSKPRCTEMVAFSFLCMPPLILKPYLLTLLFDSHMTQANESAGASI